ncbi:MAG: recombination protein O N-terminal domain-containing protein [Paludibacteraceae bacterium]|nr:recombination protein O N-terminal domain-containing protein [Paludibacteraceae bacterium]
MLSTTDAIVLSLQPHSDKAHILHAYTRACGRVNYMVYGLGRKHAIGIYTPLSLIQITADHDSSKPPTVKESALLSPFSFQLTPQKRAVALFLSEVLFHVLRHPMPDEPMFAFLAQEVMALHDTEEPQNFHLAFLAGFAEKLGFAIPETFNYTPAPLTRKERQDSLRALCAYFEEHVETWQTPKSLDILTEVFD